MNNALVTGGLGFIGSNLVRLLLKKKIVKKQCDFEKSAKVGIWFGCSKLDVATVCKIVTTFLMLRPPRQEDLEEELGISSHTVVDWFSFCREVIYILYIILIMITNYTSYILQIFYINRFVHFGLTSTARNLEVQDGLWKSMRQRLDTENITVVVF